MGCFAFCFVSGNERSLSGKPFSKSCATLAQADCKAYVNALNEFIRTFGCSQATELEIISDSGVVIDMLKTYKSQKHCEELTRYWREKILPALPATCVVIFKKVNAKESGTVDHEYLTRCRLMAESKLQEQKDLLK